MILLHESDGTDEYLFLIYDRSDSEARYILKMLYRGGEYQSASREFIEDCTRERMR